MPFPDDRLLEAELMNSTPEHVYAWLKRRAETSDDDQGSYEGDEELEEALLSRESDLIDLALARYGNSGKVVRKLFTGVHRHREGTVQIVDDSAYAARRQAQALRLASLSNRALMKQPTFERMPQLLFDASSRDVGVMLEFLMSAGQDEVIALFRNPTIDGKVLVSLYAKERPFDSLSEERWQHLIECSHVYPGLRKPMEFRSSVAWGPPASAWIPDKAWALAARVPPTLRWAEIPSSVTSGLASSEFRLFPVCVVVEQDGSDPTMAS